MTFLSVLLALFIERAVPQHRPQRRHGWFDGYCRRLAASPFARRLMGRPWGVVLALLPPLIVVAWLQAFFGELGGLFAFAFGSAVLLYSLGPRDLAEDAEAFTEARDAGRDEQAGAIAQGLCLGEVPATEPRRSFAVARAVVVLAGSRLIGPIFWFVVFGAVGAAAYRAIHLLAARQAREDATAEMRRHSATLRQLADWAPARLAAAGYAIAGNFDAVAHAWRSFDHDPAAGGPGEAEQLLAQTGLAALDTFPIDADELEDGGDFAAGGMPPPVVEDAMALVWRNLVVWLVLIAVGSLAAALA